MDFTVAVTTRLLVQKLVCKVPIHWQGTLGALGPSRVAWLQMKPLVSLQMSGLGVWVEEWDALLSILPKALDLPIFGGARWQALEGDREDVGWL